jgi:hypothetical protein
MGKERDKEAMEMLTRYVPQPTPGAIPQNPLDGRVWGPLAARPNKCSHSCAGTSGRCRPTPCGWRSREVSSG